MNLGSRRSARSPRPRRARPRARRPAAALARPGPRARRAGLRRGAQPASTSARCAIGPISIGPSSGTFERAARRRDLARQILPAAPSPTGASAVELLGVRGALRRGLTAGRFVDSIGDPAPRRRSGRSREARRRPGCVPAPGGLELVRRRAAPPRRLAGGPRLARSRPIRRSLAGEGARARGSSAPSARRTRCGRRSAASSPSGIPFDEVEILHTDAAMYPALAWELSREHGIPCTFAGGVAAPFTRPGQAALAFLDWIAEGFAADVLREGPRLGRADASRVCRSRRRSRRRPRRRARLPRRAHGWGARGATSPRSTGSSPSSRPRSGPPRDEERPTKRERGAAERAGARAPRGARRARHSRRAPSHSPRARRRGVDLGRLAQGTRAFVAEFARVEATLDGSALSRPRSRLLRGLELLARPPLAPAEAAERLRRRRPRALGRRRTGPAPAAFTSPTSRPGVSSGRRHAFLVGLDEARHPGADLEDPVLLDDERRAINRLARARRARAVRDRPRDAARRAARLRGAPARAR